MIHTFSYPMAEGEDITEVAAENKATEQKIKNVVDSIMQKHQQDFEANDITYELRFMQGTAELEIINLEEENNLSQEVNKSFTEIEKALSEI